MTAQHDRGADSPPGILAGLTVLDATQMLAGPMAAMRLADLGADVIKVEPPGRGEINRTHGLAGQRVDGATTAYLALNRNKRSIAIDLKNPRGRSTLLRLARRADVFVQNFRTGTAERLGIDHAALRDVNPALVYCSITGYGSTGPYRDRPGQDLVIQGYSGSMWSVGSNAEPPVPGGLYSADVMTAYQAVIAILAAIYRRRETGTGAHVEVDMLNVVMDAQVQELVTFLNTGVLPVRGQERTANAYIPAPYGVYRASDGWFTLAMGDLSILGGVLGDPWLAALDDYDAGYVLRDAVYERIRDAFLHDSVDSWVARLNEAGLWAGPVYDYAQLSGDAHVAARELIVRQPLASGGHARTVAPPIRVDGHTLPMRRPAPALGADTREVLSELGGLDRDEIDALVRDGAVGELATEDLEQR